MENERVNETLKWLETVYHIKIDIRETKNLQNKKFWGNIKYNKELHSTDYFDTKEEALNEAIHIGFSKIE